METTFEEGMASPDMSEVKQAGLRADAHECRWTAESGETRAPLPDLHYACAASVRVLPVLISLHVRDSTSFLSSHFLFKAISSIRIAHVLQIVSNQIYSCLLFEFIK